MAQRGTPARLRGRSRAGRDGRSAANASASLPAAASLAVRELLTGPPRRGRVIAALPTVSYLEFPDTVPEPRVVAVGAPGALRLPNAITVKLPAGEAAPPWANLSSAPAPRTRRRAAGGARRDTGQRGGARGHSPAAADSDAWAGDGRVVFGGVPVQVRRWWDPCPVLSPLSRARLDRGIGALARACSAAEHGPGVNRQDGLSELAARCAAGDLAGAVESAERLVGLGPGLAPSGDSMLCGLLLALRLLGGALAGGTRSVWLADWLGAAVTGYAWQRTTPLAASLLHCAAHGQAAEEVSAVLRGLAGQEPVEPAARRLLSAGRQTGVELGWGLVTGCQAALALCSP